MLRVWDPALPTKLPAGASELAVSAILEQPDDASAFYAVALSPASQPRRSSLTLPYARAFACLQLERSARRWCTLGKSSTRQVCVGLR